MNIARSGTAQCGFGRGVCAFLAVGAHGIVVKGLARGFVDRIGLEGAVCRGSSCRKRLGVEFRCCVVSDQYTWSVLELLLAGLTEVDIDLKGCKPTPLVVIGSERGTLEANSPCPETESGLDEALMFRRLGGFSS